MTKALRLLGFLAALLTALPAAAQSPRSYAQAELDQMLAPVALYPDALLSQVLMAATYPLEVVQAARWKRANPGLEGEDAVRAVQNEDWDPSVKSLVAFPQILQRMDEKLDWTQSLGDAFLAQEPQVMATVQQLRQRAQAAGNLKSSEQLQVQQQGQAILVQPASPQVVYVPYYDPLVVYGPWWWPAYPPVAWAPWPGYVRPYWPGVSIGFWWGRPVGVSINFFYGNFDWYRHQVRVVHANAYYYRPPVIVNRTVVVEHGHWQHDPQHRRGVDYRQAEVRQRYVATQTERREPQRDERRNERRVERQPAPAATPVQPAVQQKTEPPRIGPRDDRRADRQASDHAQRQAQPAAPEAQRQSRQEQRANMPAAQAPQQPRAERQEQRESKREQHREARDQKG